MRQATLNYIENELFYYWETKREIESLRKEILYQHRSSSASGDGGGRSGGPSDPTARIAIELMTNTKLERMEKIVQCIESVVSRLQPEKRQLVQIIYWDRPRILTWQGAAIKLHITKRTAYRWKKEIVQAIAERGGFY